jgi:hypothetical protein
MKNNTEPTKPQIIGISYFKISVLILLILLISAISILVFQFSNKMTISDVFQKIGVNNQSREIIGKWEIYKKPTPTISIELTQTFLARPTQTPVTPMPLSEYLAQGNPWGYSHSDTSSTPTEIKIGCDFGYPPTIEYFSDGTYAGPAIAFWSSLFLWQGGQYEILGDGRIKMQTQSGFAVYNFNINRDTLTFIDDNECEIRYQRSR